MTEGLNALRPRFLHTAYYVRDLDRAVDFYARVLGMREVMRIPLGEGEVESVLSFPDNKGGGVILMARASGAPIDRGTGYSRLVLKIDDLSAALAQLAAHDVKVTKGPKDGPNGLRYAMIADPDGYTIELLQLK